MSLGVNFEVSKAHVRLNISLLPNNEDAKLSATDPAPWLSAFHHDGNGLIPYSYKQAPK